MFFDPKHYYYMIGNDMVSFDKIWHYKIWRSLLLYYIALLLIHLILYLFGFVGILLLCCILLVLCHLILWHTTSTLD